MTRIKDDLRGAAGQRCIWWFVRHLKGRVRCSSLVSTRTKGHVSLWIFPFPRPQYSTSDLQLYKQIQLFSFCQAPNFSRTICLNVTYVQIIGPSWFCFTSQQWSREGVEEAYTTQSRTTRHDKPQSGTGGLRQLAARLGRWRSKVDWTAARPNLSAPAAPPPLLPLAPLLLSSPLSPPSSPPPPPPPPPPPSPPPPLQTITHIKSYEQSIYFLPCHHNCNDIISNKM